MQVVCVDVITIRVASQAVCIKFQTMRIILEHNFFLTILLYNNQIVSPYNDKIVMIFSYFNSVST